MKFIDERQVLTRSDTIIATVIALVMGGLFVLIGGLPLVVTFVPGLVVSWALVLYLHDKQIALPEPAAFVPLFFLLLAWQFIHFDEEFLTGFYDKFPALYGSSPYTVEKFVTINMASYFVFVLACVLVFTRRIRFLVLPMLFFIVYGAIGNAIAHTVWVIMVKGYFPGFFTAQLYWVLGPLVLARFVGSKKIAWTAIALFAALLVPLISATATC